MTWDNARTFCNENAPYNVGELTSIPDAATNDFLHTLIKDKDVWVGGYYDNITSGWQWTDGTPWQLGNWDTDQPSNEGDKDHLAINLKSAKWWDMKITAKLHFICQYKP